MDGSARPSASLTTRRTAAGLLAAGVVVLLVLLQSSLGTWLLPRLGLTPPPRPFLELYFSEPGAHPDTVRPGEVVPVSFVLAGHEGDFTDLAWRIDTIDASGSTQAATGRATVPMGESRTVATAVPIPCDGATEAQPRTELRVTVAEPAQEILFWVTCTAGGA